MKKWIRFNYDKFVELGTKPELILLTGGYDPNSADVVRKQLKRFVVRIVDVSLPGRYFILGVAQDRACPDTACPMKFDAEGEPSRDPGIWEIINPWLWMQVEVKEAKKYYIVSYPIEDLGPQENIHRRTTRTLYQSQQEAECVSRTWKGRIFIHEITVNE